MIGLEDFVWSLLVCYFNCFNGSLIKRTKDKEYRRIKFLKQHLGTQKSKMSITIILIVPLEIILKINTGEEEPGERDYAWNVIV